MPMFFACIYFWSGGYDRAEFGERGDAVAWARSRAGKRDRVEIGFVGGNGALYAKDCGNLLEVHP